MDIHERAAQVAAQIIRILQQEGAPNTIVLASYASREDYAELNRDPGEMTYDDHLRELRIIGELLAEAKLADRVVFQDIESGEYWRWIAKNGIDDTPAALASFADLKFHGKLNAGVNLDKLKTGGAK